MIDAVSAGFPLGAVVPTSAEEAEQGARRLQVETFEGRVYDDVYYVASDARRDLAILKVPVEGAVSLRLFTVGSRVPPATASALGRH